MSDSFVNAPLAVHIFVVVAGLLSVGTVVGVAVWAMMKVRRVTGDIHAFADATPDVAVVSFPRAFWENRYPELKGHIDGIPVQVTVSGGGRYSSEYVLYRATCTARLPDGLELRAQGLESTIGKMFGGQDIEVGDPAFDAALVIKGTDEDAIRRFFADARLRSQLLHGIVDEIGLSTGVFHWREDGNKTDRDTIREHLEQLVTLAQVMNRAGSAALATASRQPPQQPGSRTIGDHAGGVGGEADGSPMLSNKWTAFRNLPKWLTPLYVSGLVLSPLLFAGLFYIPYVIVPSLIFVGYLVFRAWPSKPTIELTADALVICQRGVRYELPLRYLLCAYGPWSTRHLPRAGTLLYVQCGEQTATIGGYRYELPTYQVDVGAKPDVTLSDRAFGELVESLQEQLDAVRGTGVEVV